jgi:hypothetical protein
VDCAQGRQQHKPTVTGAKAMTTDNIGTPKALPQPPEYAFHPLAEMFPLIEGGDLNALVEDIARRGLLNPIILYRGKILDGRNRYLAAKEAKYRFSDRDFKDLADGLDPEAFVISANIHRRQLSTKQKREFIAKLIESKPAGTSDREIAKLACVDPHTVKSVREEVRNRFEKFLATFDALSPAQRRNFIAARGSQLTL